MSITVRACARCGHSFDFDPGAINIEFDNIELGGTVFLPKCPMCGYVNEVEISRGEEVCQISPEDMSEEVDG